jgi:4-hydroxybenzoate polyprenyltransferase
MITLRRCILWVGVFWGCTSASRADHGREELTGLPMWQLLILAVVVFAGFFLVMWLRNRKVKAKRPRDKTT